LMIVGAIGADAIAQDRRRGNPVALPCAGIR
jgi:hypothetical protein